MNELNKKHLMPSSHTKEVLSNKDLALLNDLHAALQNEKHHKSFMMI
ncbi:TPA: hemolysin secretion protein D, partial [Proteus mirabilis]|nr:hemolysin secretion protein D [Proteus mirabilis]